MADWVVESTAEALSELCRHADCVGVTNTDEFTVRSMFMRAAADRVNAPRFQTEWRRFDLLVQSDSESVLIEFKHYVLRRTFDLDGRALGYKGGASAKNEQEFWTCVTKLHERAPKQIDERLLILMYQREYTRASKHSFHKSYADIPTTHPVARVWPLACGPFEARILQVQSQ